MMAAKGKQANGHANSGGVVYSKKGPMVPLAELLKRELKNEKIERPNIRCGQAGQSKKGEDFTLIKLDCQKIPGDGTSTFAVFAIFDGHNGSAAAVYSKENLLKDIMSAIPAGLSRDEWLAALPRAMVAGFVKTDKEFQVKEQTSGTTVTFVIIDCWTITVASVGDSRCILESAGGLVSLLTADHRLEVNHEERERIAASGGEIGRLNTVGGAEIGPLRCWPGGLCLSRSIGDMDVGEFIVPIPHVKQIKLSNVGGRLIIATDGVWDALSSEKAANCCRGLPAELAAKQIVKEALRIRGLRDDTTCIIVDLIPPERPTSTPPIKKQGKFKSMFRRKSHDSTSKVVEKGQDIVQEIFEEGSAMLAERLGPEYGVPTVSGLFACAVCQTDITPSEGISVHAGSFFSGAMRSWKGPFLCASCKLKKDAMEGKRPLRVLVT
uniref:protein-serine/threonine phosphatase n=1 Tax=Araucaria cunninghamii TaxID=56994 RepID=A0A0D6QXX2_ARACU